ncbi:hypothetical protein HKX48_009530 [Thoreauomyces humboldtii]|nr:hypothetical protein HKX48_009530 [Thoreauomyces humboldtii]
MVKSAYYSQLPTIRCRDCGQVLDYTVPHHCNGTVPDFAGEELQRMRQPRPQQPYPPQQQQFRPPNPPYPPPSPAPSHGPPPNPYSRSHDDYYGHGAASPQPSPNTSPDSSYDRGQPRDRYPQNGQQLHRQDSGVANSQDRPFYGERAEKPRYADADQEGARRQQSRDKSRTRGDSGRPRNKELASIRTQDLKGNAQRNAPHSAPDAHRGTISDVMFDLIDDLSLDDRDNQRNQHSHDDRRQNQQPMSARPSGPSGDMGVRGRKRRPPCGACKREITEPKLAYQIPALGRAFHIACFRCCGCGASFDEHNPYIPHEGQPYCEADYNLAVNTVCGGCGMGIVEDGQAVYALGKAWHPKHLRCAACDLPIKGNPFEHGDRVFCQADYAALIAPKCRECGEHISGETICALDATFHKECFVCQVCKDPFPDKSFYVVDSDPLCRLHYHERNNSLCGGCRQPIEGPCADIAEMNARYHPDCWCCTTCSTPLTATYYSFGSRPYCERDIMKVYRAEKMTQKANKRQTLMIDV